MYTGGDTNNVPLLDTIIQSLVSKRAQGFSVDNGVWTPAVNSLPSRSLGAVKVPNVDFIYQFADQNPNITTWGLAFNQYKDTPTASTVQNIEYELWYNFTQTQRKYGVPGAPPYVIATREPFNDDMVAMMRAVDEAIISAVSGSQASMDVQLKNFPELPDSVYSGCQNPDKIFNALGAVFLLIPMTIIFFNTVNSIVNEKEKNLKDSMEMVGLKPIVYWSGHFLSIFILVLVNALVTCLAGLAMGFSLFQHSNFGLLFLFFGLVGAAWLAFALALSSITSKVKTGIGLGFFFVIISVIYCGIGGFVAYVWYTGSDATTDLNPGWGVLMFFPFFNYNKFIQDALKYTASSVALGSTSCIIVPGNWFGFGQLYQPVPAGSSIGGALDPNLVPHPGQSLGLLFMNVIVWFLLALYFDRVIPNDNGYGMHPLYFLFPSYWNMQPPLWYRDRYPTQFQKSNTIQSSGTTNYNEEDQDIVAERQETYAYVPKNADQPDGNPKGLVIAGLTKRYDGSLKTLIAWMFRIFGISENRLSRLPKAFGESKTAIHELSLSIGKGSMLALLGSNGAGKTSTMKIMYGVSPATNGYMSIFGRSVRTQMMEIRKNLGVCQQFDILFPDLSAAEHIELYCGIKGLPVTEMAIVSEQRMKQMKLWNVRHQRSSEYSGGMKRRLSLILSTIGDPDCVFLDEPTTGMDPVNRLCVWGFLEEFKKNRVIVLTTHSLEEADILADKIAIMSQGRLKAVGNSVHLKNKFGSGYRISIIVSRGDQVAMVKSRIEAACPKGGAKVDEEEYIGASSTDTDEIRASQTCRLVYLCLEMSAVKSVVGFLENATSESVATGTDDSLKGVIASFGMSQSTLEDVFLRVVKE